MRSLMWLALLTASAALADNGVSPFASWAPLSDADKQSSAPSVDKNAGLEALFWRVHVVDELQGQDLQRVLYHYVRLKVFTPEGKEKAASFEIQYPPKTAILSVAGRTIKPDGSILEMSKDAIHDQVVEKTGRTKYRAKSFAMPGVEVGSILEYRWKEIRDDPRILYMSLQFQREYPVRQVTYYLKPLSSQYTSYRMSVWPFNCKPTKLQEDNNGFSFTTLENVPAFRDEPFTPGEPNIRPWALILYREDSGAREPQKYWNNLGRKFYGELKSSLKTNDELKTAVAKTVEGAKDDQEKVIRLIRYVRAHVRGYTDPGVTEAERLNVLKSLPKNRHRTAAEVLRSGLGNADERNTLFAALAMEAGLEARPALVANRTDLHFDERLADAYFLDNIDMAVKIGENWRLYDVSTRLLPANMLSWSEEGMSALLTDPKNPTFIRAQVSAADDSVQQRRANLTLRPDGTLEGDVEELRTGHKAREEREDYDGESAERQQEKLKEELQKLYPQSEVSAIKLANTDNPELPFETRYHIRIPNYAQRTGKRLLFQPLYFQHDDKPLFASAERHYDVELPYGWRESDQVTFNLPEGFELEKPENPGNLNFGTPGSYSLLFTTPDQRRLVCARELTFGKDSALYFGKEVYPKLKMIFDEIHPRDQLTLSLRQSAAKAGAQ